MSRVARRQAPGMGSVPYLEGYDVIDRANSIFGFTWSFDLIGDPVIVRWQKKVLIWNQQEKRKVPALDANGNVQTEEVGLVYITGKVTVDLDGKPYSHADLGRCVFTGDTPEALDMALAGSATDCLKRCFRQMGEQFGNLLYDKEIAQNAGLDQNQSNVTSSTAIPTSKAKPLPSATPIVRKYGDGISVNGNVSEQEAFDQFKEKTGKVPASKDELRNWLTSQRATPTPASVAAEKTTYQRERKNTMYQTIILIGNLGKDPEMRFTPSGQPVTTLSVATNRRYNGQNGQPVKETTWFRITVWGKQAESCNEFLHKGSKVLVEGRLTPDPETGGPHIWENNGKVGASFEVTASTVRFLSGREDQDEAEPVVNGQVPQNLDPGEIPF